MAGVGLGLFWPDQFAEPDYGTLWLLASPIYCVPAARPAYHRQRGVPQVDPACEKVRSCARYQMRTVTLPLLRPGMVAAWLLIFIASIRELGVSIFLMGPNSKVIAPAIVNSWLTSSSELSAAMALIQTAMVFIAVAFMFGLARRVSGVTP